MLDSDDALHAQTNKLIADLWKRNRPVLMERLALLDAAALAARSGCLDDSQRAEAESTAHKLSGSLGMFGYQEGTLVARLLEAELQSSAPDPDRLQDLAASLRAHLFPLEDGGTA